MEQARDLVNRASELYGAGRPDEAAALCRAAVALSPDLLAANGNFGVIAAGLGRLDEAVTALRQAVRIDPGQLDTRLNLAVVLNRRVGNRAGQTLRDIRTVRQQYENLPFPPRDPEAEHYALKVSTPDILAKINQYGFGGARDFSQPFRVLVAGCGTGDSAVWLANQLRGFPADITAIDLSEASLDVARSRAAMRGLGNINWVHGSLLDIAALAAGPYDYITCLGVLHHLPDPEAGLRALESVLAAGGAMAIMVYGAVGRSHIYSLQALLRPLTKALDHPADQLAFAKRIVGNLPATNDFRQREGVDAIRNSYLSDDTNFWDTLLHAQDRAYTVSQFRDFLASAGLHVQAFGSYAGNAAISPLQYDLAFHLGDPPHLRGLAESEREDAAEILDGSLTLHTAYVTRERQAALDPAAPLAILAPMSESGRKAVTHLAAGNAEIPVTLSNGSMLTYRPSEMTRRFLAALDGVRDNATIADALGIDLDRIRADLLIPAALHWLTARLAAGTAFAPLPDRNGLSFPLPHREPSLLPF